MSTLQRPKTIYRTASRDNPYAQIVRAMLQDPSLSLEAAGALGFILSLPDNWSFNLEWLCATRRVGRDKAQRIVRELIDRGYCKRSQDRAATGRHAPVEYLFSDDPKAFSPQPENPVAVTQDVVGRQPGFPSTVQPLTVNPSLHNRQSNKSKSNKANISPPTTSLALQGTETVLDALALPFTTAVVNEITALGVDVENLLTRYAERTKGKRIRDPNAYLLQMGRDEVAKAVGVTAEQVKASNSKNRETRVASSAEALRAFNTPSDAVLKRPSARNCKYLPEIIAGLARQTFRSQEECDRALQMQITNARFRPPTGSLVGGAGLVPSQSEQPPQETEPS
ncbi:MAG: hypothetical protein HOO99_04055 [Hyphomicrobiaceae bacterium]|nr:hypothetical protein [Hyphomicrobiaceae bacterium]